MFKNESISTVWMMNGVRLKIYGRVAETPIASIHHREHISIVGADTTGSIITRADYTRRRKKKTAASTFGFALIDALGINNVTFFENDSDVVLLF
jgi:hypothetical protein